MIEATDEMVQLALDVFLVSPTDNIAQIDAGMAKALAAVLAVFVQRIEGPRSTGLCDCDDVDGDPISPRTGQTMDHHCDCLAVETAAVLLGDASKTQHANACSCQDTP
jgi:hypothetical protein